MARNEQTTSIARHLATAMLRDLSKKQLLSAATVQAVLDATYQLREQAYALNYIAPVVGECQQLDRTRVLQDQDVAAASVVGEMAAVYPELERAIALALLLREKNDNQRLFELLAEPDLPAGAMLLALALNQPSAARRGGWRSF